MRKKKACSKVLSQQLNKLMKINNVTQKELAAATGITRQSISQYQTAKTLPTSDTLVKMADFFNVSTDCLTGRDSDASGFGFYIQELKLTRNFLKMTIQYLVKEVKLIDEKLEKVGGEEEC